MLLRAQRPGGCEPGGTTQGEVLEVLGSLSPGALTVRLAAGAAPSVWEAPGPRAKWVGGCQGSCATWFYLGRKGN